MRKKHFFSILSISVICLSSLTLSTYYITKNNLGGDKSANLKVKFTPGGNITFSDLQNSTNFKVVGSNPSEYPDEYYSVQITVMFPLFNKWTNSTSSLLKISNHDILDKNVYFEAKGGSKDVQWIFLNFTQYETEKNASIVWNTKGNINYYGDWIEKDQYRYLTIPGRVGQKIFSIDFYFVAITFDKGVTKSQMEDTSWNFNIYALQSGNVNGFLVAQIFTGLVLILSIKKRRQRKLI